ncbi:XRE family transcriptional regulator [Paenibacillus sp. UMB7766-LJ446]|uniref:helix-turn-helix domain-containing protein n=1 Tax=Paenibacillus sp. UMB7766-LJ446 TaxID=3046313 RepID=UPI00255131D1|nr:XRE family transcriptional regulator [Paenibacillus sp. UMB7766-LJ446]MDK8189844.1 XRE family transcriptional regulator [Paenibacillus sp. UMB7766-LJ446]
MEPINLIVAENFKQLREKRKMSLDAVAKVSGVSKSMLGQVERGEVNPTISTVWKIANGLKISFTELINRPEAEYEEVKMEVIQPLLEDEGHFRNYPFFLFDSERRFEIYYLELDAGSNLTSDPHPAGTQEFITVFSGKLQVSVNNETLCAETGGGIRFNADKVHRYQNIGEEICRLNMVIYYPN